MTRLSIGAVFAGAVLAALACKGDPTSSLRGGPKSISLSSSVMFIDSGGGKSLDASVRDEQGNALVDDITVTSANGAIVSVVIDTTVPFPNGSEHSFIVTGVQPGTSKLIVQGGGLTDTVQVATLPINFSGAVSNLIPTAGDTVTFVSTALLKFDSTTSIRFGADEPEGTGPDDNDDIVGTVVYQSRDTIKALVPFSTAGPPELRNVVVTYVAGLKLNFKSTHIVTQTGDVYGEADSDYATAPTLTLPTTTGGSTFAITDVLQTVNTANCAEGDDHCGIYKYVANGTDSLTFTVDWSPATNTTTGANDLDIYSCDNTGVAGCFEPGGASAGSSTPETFSFVPSAGTHYLVIELFQGPNPKNLYITITKEN